MQRWGIFLVLFLALGGGCGDDSGGHGGAGGAAGAGGAGGTGGTGGTERTCVPVAPCANGVPCGGTCCVEGEWCDASSGTPTCRCGNGTDCAPMNANAICASPLAMMNHCGATCCVPPICPQ